MEKKDLVKLLDEIFTPMGFKKKGNYWIFNNLELSKVINLQKSTNGNFYYINYGYIIKKLPLINEMMHVYNRLASIDKAEQQRITNLLDFDTNIQDGVRSMELKNIITIKILSKIQFINTEEDIYDELKKRSILSDIPLIVKNYFGLSYS